MSKKIEVIIADIFKKTLNLNEMDYDVLVEAPLFTLNMNSIDFIKIIVNIEQEYDIELEPESLHLSIFPNIKSVSSYVESILEKR